MVLLLALQGCATTDTRLVKPPTPSAIVADSATGGGIGGGAFFFLLGVDGESVDFNALRASMGASAGRGAYLTLKEYQRFVPAGRHKLKLAARYAHAAPIQSMFSSAASWAADGVVEVDLRPDTRYRVNGVLDVLRREVWLEEADTGRRITARLGAVESAPSAADPPGSTYACCNLRYDGDWVSDSSRPPQGFIPAGTRIELKRFGRYNAQVEVAGQRMRIGQDYGFDIPTETWVARLVVKEDPRPRIAAMPQAVREAIGAGKVLIGMSREQVLMALSHPRPDQTPKLDAKEWKYWSEEGEEFLLVFDADGTLKEVDASRKTRALVLHTPQ